MNRSLDETLDEGGMNDLSDKQSKSNCFNLTVKLNKNNQNTIIIINQQLSSDFSKDRFRDEISIHLVHVS